MTVTRTQGHCPSCGCRTDAATDLSGKPVPADGDLSICFMCGEPAVFVVTAFGISTRKPSPEERERAMAWSTYQTWETRRRAHWARQNLTILPQDDD